MTGKDKWVQFYLFIQSFANSDLYSLQLAKVPVDVSGPMQELLLCTDSFSKSHHAAADALSTEVREGFI